MTEHLLLIDDDPVFRDLLARRLTREGFAVSSYEGAEALTHPPMQDVDLILLDLMLGQGSGLDLIGDLQARFRPRQLIVLTGYASIATTVEAMKRGATNYLAKPVDTRQLLSLLKEGATPPMPTSAADTEHRRVTPAELEWEHIQRVLLEHDGNISLTARALGMHRRTLQRKLKKRSPLR